MRKILILANNDGGVYKFRKELIERLISEGYEVYVSVPYGEFVEKMKVMGCVCIETDVDRRGIDPVKDMMLFLKYIKIIKNIKPYKVLTYTVKPNVYGGIASQICGAKYIVNITGFGSAINSRGIISSLVISLYKLGVRSANCIFFQNKSNLDYAKSINMVKGKCELLPGSGVNLMQNVLEPYPHNEICKLLFVGRIMKDKGIYELLQSVKELKEEGYKFVLDIIGSYDGVELKKQMEEFIEKGYIYYHGRQKEVHKYMKDADAIVHPTYHEGMSNVLLEAAATGRPIIASNIPGCREIVDNNMSGISFKPQNIESLKMAIKKFLGMSRQERYEMGVKGRIKVESLFDRNIVVDQYINEIEGRGNEFV